MLAQGVKLAERTKQLITVAVRSLTVDSRCCEKSYKLVSQRRSTESSRGSSQLTSPRCHLVLLRRRQ